jgi:hypothetical protein
MAHAMRLETPASGVTLTGRRGCPPVRAMPKSVHHVLGRACARAANVRGKGFLFRDVTGGRPNA